VQECSEVTPASKHLDFGLSTGVVLPGVIQTDVESAKVGVNDFLEQLGGNGVQFRGGTQDNAWA